jgi:hypothetical protein
VRPPGEAARAGASPGAEVIALARAAMQRTGRPHGPRATIDSRTHRREICPSRSTGGWGAALVGWVCAGGIKLAPDRRSGGGSWNWAARGLIVGGVKYYKFFSCLGAALGAVSACGPEPAAEVEHEEVCGQPGPLRVLELAEGEQLANGQALQVGDRVLYNVARVEAQAPGSQYPSYGESTVWSTGRCGESPVAIGSGFDRIFTVDVWPDVALACDRETGEVAVLDPLGVHEPHVVFRGAKMTPDCGLRWTDYGLLSVEPHDEDFAALLLHRFPSDPWGEAVTPQTLLDPVRITPSGRGGTGIISDTVRSFEDFVLALNGQDELVLVDLADGAVTVVQPGVRAIEASFDGRYVLWQDSAATKGAGQYPEGKIFLRDQQASSDALLAETSLRYSVFPMIWAQQGLVLLGLGPSASPQRLFFLPGLDHVDLSEGWFFNMKVDEERWIGGPQGTGYLDVITLREGETRRLFPRPAVITYADLDAGVVELLEVGPCCTEGSWNDEGPLWRVPIDEGAPQQLAARASRRMVRLTNGGWLGPVGIDAQGLGTLVLLDPETGAEQKLDEGVVATSLVTWGLWEDGLFLYSVADGDRSGVYLAKVPGSTGAEVVPRAWRGEQALTVEMVADAEGRVRPQLRAVDGWSPGGATPLMRA